MAFNFNGNTPKKILYNGLNVAKLVYNGVVVWMSKVLATISGILPLNLRNCTGDDLMDYKIYGNTDEVLPRGYTQVEYLESTGTQYIDTGIVPNVTTRVVAKIAFQEVGNDALCWGSRSSGTYSTSLDQFYCGHTGAQLWYFSARTKTIIRTVISSNVFYDIDVTNTRVSATVTQSIYLFALNNLGTAIPNSSSKIAKFEIYNNGVMVRNLIPAKRNYDNVLGMYDTVNGVFYTNAGTGTFNVGSVVSKKSVGDLVTDTSDINYGKYKIPILTNSTATNIYLNKPLRKTSKLPTGYTQVEHIRSTGTQYIDTGFKATGNTKVKIKVQLPTQTNVQQGIFGVRTGDTGRFGVFTGSRVDALRVNYNTGGALGGSTTAIPNFNATNVNEIEVSNKLIVNDVLVSEVNKTSFQSSVNLYLFTNNNNGTPQLEMEGMIWYCKIWDNDVLVRNFIPCKNPSNVVGLYDTVNDVFYTNAGSGSFIAGAEVETVYYTDYLDYENQKVVRNVDDNDKGLDTPVEETVVLPAVATDEGTVTVDVDTEIAPSNMEVVYYKNGS